MDLTQQLSIAANESGIADLALNPGEACTVILDSGPEITFELTAEGDNLFLYAPVVTLLPADRTELFEAALTLNLFGREIAGGSIAYDPGRDEILFIICRQQSSAAIDFEALTGIFVASLEHCAKVLGTPRVESNVSPTSAMMNMRV